MKKFYPVKYFVLLSIALFVASFIQIAIACEGLNCIGFAFLFLLALYIIIAELIVVIPVEAIITKKILDAQKKDKLISWKEVFKYSLIVNIITFIAVFDVIFISQYLPRSIGKMMYFENPSFLFFTFLLVIYFKILVANRFFYESEKYDKKKIAMTVFSTSLVISLLALIIFWTPFAQWVIFPALSFILGSSDNFMGKLVLI